MRVLLTVVAAGVIAAVAAVTAIVAQGWTDTQTASGNISVSASPDLLYICDWAGVGTGVCSGGDDSGPDEVIFESDESLVPGGSATWLLNFRNDSLTAWDVTDVSPGFVETIDPGADCFLMPDLQIAIFDNSRLLNDHVATASGYPALPTTTSSTEYIVHVDVGDNEEISITASLPPSTPIECQGNAWDLIIQWTAEVH